jgi:hypothetical protein
MQISTIKNLNFEHPSRNSSYRIKVNILEKKFFLIARQKNLVPVWVIAKMFEHRNQKEKERNFCLNLTKGIQGFHLGQKKFKIFSCLCTFT